MKHRLSQNKVRFFDVFKLKSHSVEQTIDYGKRLTSFLEAGDLISLIGELGTGKTVLTKGIAEGLGVKEPVTSPTFIIIREYEGRLPLFHFDIYRLQEYELDELGYKEYFFAEGVTVVEWANKIKERLPRDYLEITLLHGHQEQDRILEYKGFGTWAKKISNLEKELKK